MSEITPDVIRKIAQLARLKISDDGIQSMSDEIQQIMKYIASLEEIDVSGVEALSHVHGEHSSYREDVLTDFENKDEILSQMPDRSGSFIRVPLVIERVDS